MQKYVSPICKFRNMQANNFIKLFTIFIPIKISVLFELRITYFDSLFHCVSFKISKYCIFQRNLTFKYRNMKFIILLLKCVYYLSFEIVLINFTFVTFIFFHRNIMVTKLASDNFTQKMLVSVFSF